MPALSHIHSSANFNYNQSAYCRGHSTETSLISTLNSIYQASDSGMSSLLISLDLSAAFDTIDHNILLSCLSTSFGITGSVNVWLESYLTNRSHSVCLDSQSFIPVLCTTGVPQGSVLGPLLITTYTSPIAALPPPTILTSSNMWMTHNYT